MNTVNINHKQNRTNYTGLDEGAVPVNVYRTAMFTVAHIGEPAKDAFLNNDFREVKFVDQSTNQVFTNSLFDGHFSRLQAKDILVEGNTVQVTYEVGTGWIKSIDGERWN